MIQTLKLNGTESVLEEQPKAKEIRALRPARLRRVCRTRADRKTLGKRERKKWFGGMSFKQSVDAVRGGDVSAVAASDRLLADMEGLAPVSHSWRTINSVVGMARTCRSISRQSLQHATEAALCDSHGPAVRVCRAGRECGDRRPDVPQRGAAMLALVRMLTICGQSNCGASLPSDGQTPAPACASA